MIALYVRLSVAERADGEQASASVLTQERQLRDYVAKLEEYAGEEVRTFCDDGISGTREDRPALMSLLAFAAAGQLSCVVVRDFSRLARNYLYAGAMQFEIFPTLGVRLISIGDGYDSASVCDHAQEDLVVGFRNVINEAYSYAASERILATIRTIWGRGEHYCAWVPFGYLYDKTARGHVRIDPVAADTVRLIFRKAASGMGPCAIARYLDERGLLTPAELRLVRSGRAVGAVDGDRPKRWCAAKVSAILSREAYMGTLVAGTRTRARVGSQKKVARDPSEWVRVKNAHDPIVTREEFEAAQAVLRPRSPRQGPGRLQAGA